MINPWVGGRVSARARYIEGTHVRLETGRRIVMTWRTQDFPHDAPDSDVEILLQPAAGGTKVSIVHRSIPEGHGATARAIWRNHYLDPMKKYFGRSGGMAAAHRAAAAAGQMPTADMLGMRRARTPITSAGLVEAPLEAPAPEPAERGREKPKRTIIRKKERDRLRREALGVGSSARVAASTSSRRSTPSKAAKKASRTEESVREKAAPAQKPSKASAKPVKTKTRDEAKKSATKKSSGVATRGSTAPKTSAAKKTVAKKTVATKAKRAPSKPAAKKAPSKKAKRAPSKPAAKKTPSKKAKRAPSKPAAKKTPSKKAKPAAKKAKRSSGRR